LKHHLGVNKVWNKRRCVKGIKPKQYTLQKCGGKWEFLFLSNKSLPTDGEERRLPPLSSALGDNDKCKVFNKIENDRMKKISKKKGVLPFSQNVPDRNAASLHIVKKRVPLNVMFLKSQYLHSVSKRNQLIFWHSLFGNPTIVNKDAYEFLSQFSNPMNINDILKLYKVTDGVSQLFETFRKSKFINPIGYNEREFLKGIIQRRIEKGLNGSFIDYLELRVSEACNFNCSYCILQNAERIHKKDYKRFMDFHTAKKAVNIYFKLLKNNSKKKAEITFGGAEPTLNWSLIQKTIEYINSTYGSQLKCVFYINTNFSLLNAKRIAFIKLHKIKVSPSIDGHNALANDYTRKTKTVKGTFEVIMGTIRNLKKAGVKVPACSTTTNETNFKFINHRFIDWAKREGFREVNINIDVMNMADLNSDFVANRLIDLVRYASKLKVGLSGFWRRPAENISYSLINHRTGFCGATRGDNLAVDPLGDIYSCGYSNKIIGSIPTFDSFFDNNGKYHNFLKEMSPIALKYCQGCEIEGYCGGGCLATREFNERNNNKIKQMCDIYKMMTRKLMSDLI